MTVRRYKNGDFIELLAMYRALINTVFPKYKKGGVAAFEKEIRFWIDNKCHIFFAIADSGETSGFSVSWVENAGVIESYYRGEHLYIKPKFQRSKAAFFLYANMLQIAHARNLPVMAKGYTGNDAARILAKFGEPIFIEFQKAAHGRQ